MNLKELCSMNTNMNDIQKKELQSRLEILSKNKKIWGDMKASDRLQYLKKMYKRLQQIDHLTWGQHSSQQQGFDVDETYGQVIAASEQMINGAILVGTIRALIRTYTSLTKHATPPSLKASSSQQAFSSQKRQIISVFPYDTADFLSPYGMAKIKGEVWSKSDTIEYIQPNLGQLSLVLGAGNQSFLAFGDVMHEIFVKGNVTILKHHPIRAFSSPFYEALFQDLITDGFFLSTLGDVDISGWLCQHELVDAVHMTGGNATHDAIVWGGDRTTQEENKSNQTPVLHKPMTSELGCITPWIICSGIEWTAKQLKHHAAHLAMAFVSQKSCNCLSPKVLVVDEDWPQLEEFLDYLRSYLTQAQLPPPYYPGTEKRYQGFIDAYPAEAIEIIQSTQAPTRTDHGLGETLGWMLIHLQADSDTYALQNEAFAPVLGVYRFKGGNQFKQFFPQAVTFVNEQVWGSLSCTVLCHDHLIKTEADILEKGIADLRYGSVAINAWTTTVYALDGCTWGAYPGEALHNVTSGIGIVRNAFLIQDVEKSVLRSPFVHIGQLTLNKQGKIPFSAKQFQSLSNFIIRPGPFSMAKVAWHMMVSGPSSKS